MSEAHVSLGTGPRLKVSLVKRWGILDEEFLTAEGPARDRLEEALGALSEAPTEYVWVWGFYGEPTTPFDPHQALGDRDFTTTDPEHDPDLYNEGEPFLDGDLYQPGDHLGCTCEWISQLSDQVEQDMVDAFADLGPEGATNIPGGAGDTSPLAEGLRTEAARLR